MVQSRPWSGFCTPKASALPSEIRPCFTNGGNYYNGKFNLWNFWSLRKLNYDDSYFLACTAPGRTIMLIGLTDILINWTFFDVWDAKIWFYFSLILGTAVLSAIAKFDLEVAIISAIVGFQPMRHVKWQFFDAKSLSW